MDHLASRFEEALTIIATLLREREIDFEGRYYTARECELRPIGPRPQGPPIMVGAAGERMMRLAARHADIWNRDFGAFSSIAELPTWQARIDAACREVGRDPATLERTAAVGVDLPGATPREGWNGLTGSPEEMAESLRAYANAGITHVQLWIAPATMDGINAMGPVLELLDTYG